MINIIDLLIYFAAGIILIALFKTIFQTNKK